jgi:hypothetical protein
MTHLLPTLSNRRLSYAGRSQRRLSNRWLVVPALVALALVAGGWVFAADGQTGRPTRVLVVVDATVTRDAALPARAASVLRRAEARLGIAGQLRVTHGATEQLSVTHFFAAKRYDAVVGVGLDRRVAVNPVAARFPGTKFTLASERGLAATIARAATR